MPRRASRSLGCAGAARRLLPLSPGAVAPLAASRPCQPQPQTPPLRSRAGSFAVLRWGGRALSAANAGIIGAPSSPRFQRVRGFGFLEVQHLPASATRHEPPRPCTVAGPRSGRKLPPTRSATLPRRPSASHRADRIGSPHVDECSGETGSVQQLDKAPAPPDEGWHGPPQPGTATAHPQ